LPMIMLIMPSVIYICLRSTRARSLTLILLAMSAFSGALGTAAALRSGSRAPFTSAELDLTAWLNSLPDTVTILTTRPQTLSIRTRRGLHWTACREPATQTATFIEHLSVDLIVSFPGEEQCAFLSKEALQVRKTFEGPSGAIIAWEP